MVGAEATAVIGPGSHQRCHMTGHQKPDATRCVYFVTGADRAITQFITGLFLSLSALVVCVCVPVAIATDEDEDGTAALSTNSGCRQRINQSDGC